MHSVLNILIVDSQPLMIECTQKILKKLSRTRSDVEFKIRSAKNCDTADTEMEKAVLATPFDLVILDIKLQSSIDKNLLCGQDVAIKLKKLFPKVKIIVVTALDNKYRIHNILQTINPEGFLIKTEIDEKRLRKAINNVIDSKPSYTKTVGKVMRSNISNEFALDKTDRRILFELSNGITNTEIAKLFDISKFSYESRKARMKDLFDITKGDDKDLIRCAKEKGFV